MGSVFYKCVHFSLSTCWSNFVNRELCGQSYSCASKSEASCKSVKTKLTAVLLFPPSIVSQKKEWDYSIQYVLPDMAFSPLAGGVGFDINCGVRLLRTNLDESDVQPVKEQLAQAMFDHIPVGVGSKGVIPMSAK